MWYPQTIILSLKDKVARVVAILIFLSVVCLA
jgi:hypothetical protein